MKKVTATVVVIIAALLTGCANTGNKSLKDVSEQQIQKSMVVGQTTIEQVRAQFGSPIKALFTDGGLAIWTFQYDDTTALTPQTVGSVMFTFGLLGTKSKGTRNELVILFDESTL